MVDNTRMYSTTEMHNITRDHKDVKDICFLDNNLLLISVSNGNNQDNTYLNYDLYRYDLTKKTTALVCKQFMIYPDDTINVKDTDNFTINYFT